MVCCITHRGWQRKQHLAQLLALKPSLCLISCAGLNGYTQALVAAAFIIGLGAGVYFDSEVSLNPSNVASTELVDRRTPNSELCMAYGSSAMVFDERLFVSFNP